jgi:hypothetical protein
MANPAVVGAAFFGHKRALHTLFDGCTAKSWRNIMKQIPLVNIFFSIWRNEQHLREYLIFLIKQCQINLLSISKKRDKDNMPR